MFNVAVIVPLVPMLRIAPLMKAASLEILVPRPRRKLPLDFGARLQPPTGRYRKGGGFYPPGYIPPPVALWQLAGIERGWWRP